VTGPVVVYEFTTPSGRTSTQRLCGVCHARIYNTNSARPNVAIVRAGTLDRSNELRVVAHIWVKRKQHWLTLPEGVPTWPESAPCDRAAAGPGAALSAAASWSGGARCRQERIHCFGVVRFRLGVDLRAQQLNVCSRPRAASDEGRLPGLACNIRGRNAVFCHALGPGGQNA
jgi:hypothetical protein